MVLHPAQPPLRARPAADTDAPPNFRIGEPDQADIEPLGIKPTADPLKLFIVVGRVHVFDRLQKPLIPWGAANILRRAGPLSGNATWINDALLLRQYGLQRYRVLPAIAEIVLVLARRAGLLEVEGDHLAPAWQVGLDSFYALIIRYADVDRLARPRALELEMVEMVVQPAQAVRNGAVQVPERVEIGHLDAPPDLGLDPVQGDLKLIDMTEGGVVPVGFRERGWWLWRWVSHDVLSLTDILLHRAGNTSPF